jgi:hypothetical protein
LERRNVIVLGSGASFSAGVPILRDFLPKMWEIAIRGQLDEIPLSDEDRKIFKNAMSVRAELDGYHGRANFDDRNIEDVLSVLSFNAGGQNRSTSNRLAAFVRAITRTIELTCSIKQNRKPNAIDDSGPDCYRDFWVSLINRYSREGDFPSIITFNYDLVLERSLYQVIRNTIFSSGKPLPFDTFDIDYCYRNFPCIPSRVRYTRYTTNGLFEETSGTTCESMGDVDEESHLHFEILKLHGSVNFPRRKGDEVNEDPFTSSVVDASIVPPVSFKSASGNQSSIWETALKRISSANNIIFVGYSMPRTDLHVQYFFKAAVGPNRDLNKITVFDPALYEATETGEQLSNRYKECFAPQLRTRIDFQPPPTPSRPGPNGSYTHFVNLIDDDPDQMFF